MEGQRGMGCRMFRSLHYAHHSVSSLVLVFYLCLAQINHLNYLNYLCQQLVSQLNFQGLVIHTFRLTATLTVSCLRRNIGNNGFNLFFVLREFDQKVLRVKAGIAPTSATTTPSPTP